MKHLKKFVSFLLALVLVLGFAAPAFAQTSDPTHQTVIAIHKILMDPEDMAGHTDTNKDPKYTGSQIENINQYFSESAKEIAGVAFDVYREVALYEGAEGLLAYNDPVLGGLGTEGNLYKKVNTTSYLTAAQTAGGTYVLTEPLSDGTYIIVENKEKSTYVGKDGAALTDSKAIPTKITLPMDRDNKGHLFDVQNPLHIYPKNTESAPKIDKNFKKDNGLQFDADTQSNGIAGADYDSYAKDKATATAMVGDVIPYEVKTEIPAKSDYKTVRWEDTMTHGLTFNKDVKVFLGEEEFASSNYTLTQNASGFTLTLNEAGLAALKTAVETNAATFKLTYSATVNESAVVDVKDENRVIFNYGNAPQSFNEPSNTTTTPQENKINVTKTWASGKAPEAASVTYYLYEVGQKEGQIDHTLDQVVATQTVTADPFNATFEGLDAEKSYYVKEVVKGYTPSYANGEAGTLTVTNTENDYPTPLEPTHPTVVTHGKKFVKADADNGARLAGAEFVVQKTTTSDAGDVTQYLALKNADQKTTETAAIETTRTNYLAAVGAYNQAVKKAEETFTVKIGNVDYTSKEEAQAAIDELKTTYFDAMEALNTEWTFVDSQDAAFKFVSDQYGRFEVTGLPTGEYALVELTAPTDYATIKEPVAFSVAQGSYTQVAGGVDYAGTANVTANDATKDAQRVDNKIIKIPETGGMGTILFTVVGLAIMAGAVVLMKRNQKEQAL